MPDIKTVLKKQNSLTTKIHENARYLITEKDVDVKFDEFLENLYRCQNEKDKKLITKAYNFAKNAHKGETRFSGDAFISHPLDVAKIVANDIGLSATSISAALLHDVVTNTESGLSDIEVSFGKEIASIVRNLTKANETMYVYAPLAERIGLFIIKSKLEDYAFKYLQPDDYNKIAKRIKHSRQKNVNYLNKFSLPIIAKLFKKGYKFDIISRQKSVYSIWNKMVNKKVSLDSVYDIFAVRIIVTPKSDETEKEECKEIFTIISALYELNPQRIRNWIDEPKENGYQALHLTVRGQRNRWVEVQIRSKKMNEIAEMGIASHLDYKGVLDKKITFDNKINELKKKFELGTEANFDYLSDFKLLFTTEIVVYTPKGDEIILPVGATVLDFAFSIHTNLGMRCIGAKVNNKLLPIDQIIQTGDYIEILTSKSQEPKMEWLNFVKIPKVKYKLHELLKIRKIDEREKGQQVLAEVLKKYDYTPVPELFQVLTKFFKLKNKHELYFKIGSGEIEKSKLDSIIKKKSRWQFKNFIKPQLPRFLSKEQKEIIIDDDTDYKVASCCNPLPGEKTIGFKNEDNQIIVHKAICEVAKKQEKTSNHFPLTWKIYKAKSFKNRLKIEVESQFGVLSKITNIMSNSMDINIKSIHFETEDREHLLTGWIEFYVLNKEHLNLLIEKLQTIEGLKAETIDVF